MTKIEKIQGNAVLELFEELQHHKIPVTLFSKNEVHRSMVYIVDIRKLKRIPHFLIKYRKGFQQATENLDSQKLHFEFIGSDKIKYAFETNGGEILRGLKWIRFPESVHRYQRRRLFRLEAPHGTRLYFKVNNTCYTLLVINISLGGTLGVLVSLTKQMEKELKLYSLKTLENVELIFPARRDNYDDSKVKIKRCRINRQARNPLTNKYECAMEFQEMTEIEQKKLTELFYQWQRAYLRKRRLFEV
ncbi:MAG: hypothetical protein HKO68_18290 [Desulfobacterales bacterium]|nr:hypothetical protein [Deltaproteobacteria bacterium]NNL78285.1 hypothetical protein [Desulfobacterales bacterium]